MFNYLHTNSKTIQPTFLGRLALVAAQWFVALIGFGIVNPAEAQVQFRDPTIPNSMTIGDHGDRTPAHQRFGLSPHLTSSQSIDLGVQQKGFQTASNDIQATPPEPARPFETTFEKTASANNHDFPVSFQTPDRSDALNLETIDGIEQFSDEAEPQQSSTETNYRTRRPSSGREIIVQRYPDGKPQIEREVIQDSNGNFVNDGFWRVLSRTGERNVIAAGQYQLGVMHGQWSRQHTKESSGLFVTTPFDKFEGPFISTVTFNQGKLDGMWTLSDTYERKIFEIPYRRGVRHGTAIWWFPSMNKMREVAFNEGLLDGKLQEWNEQNKLTRDEEFVKGQKIIRNVTFYRPKQKESENYYLDAKLKVDGEDNWWDAEPAPTVSVGKRLQHGPAMAWYDNGLPKMKGQYGEGLRVGRFTWWHSNGNKQLEGAYNQGKKIGSWTWWHDNGMQAIEGVYDDDMAVGIWRAWEPNGKLESEEDLSETPNSNEHATESSSEVQLIDSADDSHETLPEGNTQPIWGDDRDADRVPSLLDTNDLEGIDPLNSPTPALPSNAGPDDDEFGLLPANLFQE